MNQPTKNYYITPEVLKWARITIGYDLKTASSKLNIDIKKLEGWESGNEEAPIEKLKKFSEVYKRATVVFLLNNIPEEDVSPAFRKILYSNIHSFSTDTLLAIRQAIRVQNLSKDIVDNQKNQFLSKLKQLVDISDNDKKALEIIKLLELDEKDITSPKDIYEQLNLWKNAIEAKGIYILELGFPVEEARGFTLYDEVSPVITLNTHDHPRVRIFTLLHELSHLLFSTDSIDDSSTLFDFTSSHKLEVSCNNLAGSILVPSSYLEQKIKTLDLDISNDVDSSMEILARAFHISKQVVIRRLYAQNFISKDQYIRINNILRESYRQGSQEGKKPTGGNFYIKFMKNNSKAFIYDVLEAYRVNRIGYFDVLSFLNIKSSTLSKLESRL